MLHESMVTRRAALGMAVAGVAGGITAFPGHAAPLRTASPELKALDQIVEEFMKAFEIPGVAVGIARIGEPSILRTYGRRSIRSAEPVNADTLFAIASNTKAFLSAGMALLVDEGRLEWDAPVRRYMPDFEMSDPVVTQMMTVRDLLVHRSGLPLGAGDLMLVAISHHKREDFLRALKHLQLERGFRTGYHYDNILYVVAGLLIERIVGTTWEEFLSRRFFEPLGMRTAVANIELVRTANVAGRHARLGPPVRGVGRLQEVPPGETAAAAPAGGIHLSISEVIPWVEVQLRRGVMSDGTRLWSEAQAAELWKPQVITRSTRGPTADLPHRAVLSAYALGWRVTDFRNHLLVGHGGILAGQNSRIELLPEQGIGLALFTNTEDTRVIDGLEYALLDNLLGIHSSDWIKITRKMLQEQEESLAKRLQNGNFVQPSGGPSLPLESYVGRYRDPWYGDIEVTLIGNRLHIDFLPTPDFSSVLIPWGEDTFRTEFQPHAGEDAVVTFLIDDAQVKGVKMKALSPIADFSFDFHHLNFTRLP